MVYCTVTSKTLRDGKGSKFSVGNMMGSATKTQNSWSEEDLSLNIWPRSVAFTDPTLTHFPLRSRLMVDGAAAEETMKEK